MTSFFAFVSFFPIILEERQKRKRLTELGMRFEQRYPKSLKVFQKYPLTWVSRSTHGEHEDEDEQPEVLLDHELNLKYSS